MSNKVNKPMGLLSKFISLLFRRKTRERLRNCYRDTLNLVTQKQKDCFSEIANNETNPLWARIMLKQLLIDSERGNWLLESAKTKHAEPERLSEALADLEAANQEFSRLLNQLKQVYASASTR